MFCTTYFLPFTTISLGKFTTTPKGIVPWSIPNIYPLITKQEAKAGDFIGQTLQHIYSFLLPSRFYLQIMRLTPSPQYFTHIAKATLTRKVSDTRPIQALDNEQLEMLTQLRISHPRRARARRPIIRQARTSKSGHTRLECNTRPTGSLLVPRCYGCLGNGYRR